MNQPLAKPLRTQLENAVKAARVVAETGALATLSQLAVGEAKAPDYLTDEHKALRRRLRAHGRALGDELNANGSQTLQHLVWEGAYEHWHRMLFARFLAENGLLLWEPGAAVSLDDCEALVQEVDPAMNLGAKTQWELAGKLAARMLPQVFKPQSPVFELTFAPEHQRELERLLATLPPEVFKASDSLGWVYQFWQAKRKDEVNASEVKIGADELPAVTQLFTEPYMVDFLLHNSLGAWWAARRLSEQDLREAQTEDELRRKAAIPGVPLDYLRFVFAPAPHDGDDDVVRASSPEKSGQDGLTTQARVPFDERTLEKTHGEYLPHWTCQGAVYHVVFRLADSVPQSKLAQWDEDLAAELTDEALREARYRKHQEMENWLDAGHGVCHFRQPEIAELVANALKHFDGDRYQLHAWCVMPNHVHVIVEPLSDNPLYKIIHSWKSFTANAINRQLEVSGTLWQADAYNHIIRTQKEYDYQVQYVWQNPDKANLPDWPWRWANVVIRASSPEESEESGQDGLTTAGWALAAGAYEGWPDTLADFKLLDPCCGSGHFLVAAFLLLVPMRMVAEDLTAAEAVDAVLRDNLHGLELDARCVEIAVFALALAAWCFPDENGDPLGVRADMPAPQIACCGLKVAAKAEEWMALVPDDWPNAAFVRQELKLLHASFAQAPLLGSLLDLARVLKNDLATSSFDILRELLERALSTERSATLGGQQASELQDDAWDLALTARGLLDAARLLDAQYNLVITNVPYLAHGKQQEALRIYCESNYPEAKNDLATVFLARSLELASSAPNGGVVQIVMPFNWTFLATFKKLRMKVFRENSIGLAANIGAQAFETPLWDFNIGLFTIARKSNRKTQISALNCADAKGVLEKPVALLGRKIKSISQSSQVDNPGSRLIMEDAYHGERLSSYASVYKGICSGDGERFIFNFWELPEASQEWEFMQGSFASTSSFGGMDSIFRWEKGCGSFHRYVVERLGETGVNAWIRGLDAWNKRGVTFRIMGDLPSVGYLGSAFDNNVSVVVPKNEEDVVPIYAFLTSELYSKEVRKINSKVSVTDDAFVQVPFDRTHWQTVAEERFPNGLPRPYSDDPTQWLFHGHPQPATDPLQVAVARLAGYRWPAETDMDMELADEAHTWIAHCEKLDEHTDDDGIVCLPSVRGEAPAHDRLLKILIAAWETVQPGSWKPAVLDKLLADADCAGKGLDVWLRDKFFEQHAKRFHHRPFIWHVWDGLKDGFTALVNYHQLDHKKLERLIHTYLGDWIRQQEAGVRDGIDGAPQRLAAAQDLKRRLELILEGEPPYDIFVRWKPLAEQPMGWNPDLNDGVRLNIRPFMTAEALRHNKKPKLNITWDKDRGKDVESAPWFHNFEGDRINDHHLTVAEKREARGQS